MVARGAQRMHTCCSLWHPDACAVRHAGPVSLTALRCKQTSSQTASCCRAGHGGGYGEGHAGQPHRQRRRLGRGAVPVHAEGAGLSADWKHVVFCLMACSTDQHAIRPPLPGSCCLRRPLRPPPAKHGCRCSGCQILVISPLKPKRSTRRCARASRWTTWTW